MLVLIGADCTGAAGTFAPVLIKVVGVSIVSPQYFFGTLHLSNVEIT